MEEELALSSSLEALPLNDMRSPNKHTSGQNMTLSKLEYEGTELINQLDSLLSQNE